MMNRSISALITMLPGAREVPATVSAKGQSVSWVSVGGGGGQNVVMVVDGVDNKEDHCGGASLAYSLDGIQEFQVFKTGAQAEYGRGTAAILVATKSGTNRFSGSAFGFYRDDSTVANDYFSKPENGGSGEPPFLRTQLGGSFGGPMLRDKAWFFGAFEHIVQDIERPRPVAVSRELDLLVPLNIGVLASPTLAAASARHPGPGQRSTSTRAPTTATSSGTRGSTATWTTPSAAPGRRCSTTRRDSIGTGRTC